MSERIGGAFPGGPSRKTTAPQRQGPPRLETVEEIEAARADRGLRRRDRKRRRRVVYALAFVMALAGGVGLYLGFESHQSVDELRAEAERAASPQSELSAEVNRTLLELWRMEEVEYARNRGR